jgi:N-methylhydantoinase B
MARDVTVLADAVLTLSSDRHRLRPWGVEGGMSATGATCLRRGLDGRLEELPVKMTGMLRAGQRLSIITPGGGGWGDPATRPRPLVMRDVEEGMVSPERAESIYGLSLGKRALGPVRQERHEHGDEGSRS